MTIKISSISQFFFFAIPLVLALGALYWLLFVSEARIFMRTVSQDKRHAEIVGAAILPKAKMNIEINDSRDGVLKIERAEIDNGDLWIYYRNSGAARVSYIQVEWKLISPDNTVLKQEEQYVSIYSKNNAPDALDGGELGEAHMKIPSDPRAVTIKLRMVNN